MPLTNGADNTPLQAIYYRGANGEVARPGHPLLPLEIANVTHSSGVLRGVGFRGGTYSDELNVHPYTSVPATEVAGSHPVFYSSVFFPIQPWLTNYYDYLADPSAGTIRLMLTPTQYKSNGVGATTGTMRSFSAMAFRLFYSQDKSAAAVAAAPTLARIGSAVDGNTVSFAIEANSSNEMADVQAVWVTYSTLNGNSWQSVDLTRAVDNPVLWQGMLTLPNGVAAADVRFMVQAASGTGLITLDTNRGQYFTPGIDPGDLNLGEQVETVLTLENPPAAGTFTEIVAFTARLTSNGTPLAGEVLSFALGTQHVQATTNSEGRASVTILLSDKPAAYTLQAAFAGSADYAESSAASPFTINKLATNLVLTPDTLTLEQGESKSLTALLKDGAGRGLRERAVVFVILNNNNVVYSRSVDTDYQGRAVLALGEAALVPGTYAVTAYFGGGTPIPGFTLTDDYYLPSTANATLQVEEAIPVPLQMFLPRIAP